MLFPRYRKALTTLTAELGVAEVLRLIGLFFTSTNPRIVACDFSVAAFLREAPRLRLGDQRPTLAVSRWEENMAVAARVCGKEIA